MSDSTIDRLRTALETGLLLDNAIVRIHTWRPASGLPELAANQESLRAELLAQASALGWPSETVEAMRIAWLERIKSGLLAQYGFAFNLFRIDEDNWFSFERARDAASWFAEPEYLASRRELWLVKGVSARPLLDGRSVPPDMMAVADLGADSMHFVLIGLAD